MEQLKHELRGLLEACMPHARYTLRRSRDEGSLYAVAFAPDVPEMLTARFTEAARKAGWICTPGNGWLLMDHAVPVPEPCTCVLTGERRCLQKIMDTHACTAPGMDTLRRVQRAWDAGATSAERLCLELHHECAARMRRHEKPEDLRPWLGALEKCCQGSKKE